MNSPRARRRLVRALGVLALAVAVLYALAILWLISQETRLVFATGSTFATALPTVPYQQVDVPRADGAKQYAWVYRQDAHADSTPWLLYLHGNAASIASRLNISHCERLRALGLNVMAPEYRGFGGLRGSPSERGLAADALAAYAYLREQQHVPAERIVVFGWSLGSGVAVELASTVPVAAVILEGAPASLAAIGQQQYPMFPVRLLMRNQFDSISRIDRVRAPLLFLHSPADTLIPISEARRLFDAARSAKTFVEVPGGHIHSSDTNPDAFYGAIAAFLQKAAVTPR